MGCKNFLFIEYIAASFPNPPAIASLLPKEVSSFPCLALRQKRLQFRLCLVASISTSPYHRRTFFDNLGLAPSFIAINLLKMQKKTPNFGTQSVSNSIILIGISWMRIWSCLVLLRWVSKYVYTISSVLSANTSVLQ